MEWPGSGGAGTPMASSHVVNRVSISSRYWTAVSLCRRGRKCADVQLNAERNRCAPLAKGETPARRG